MKISLLFVCTLLIFTCSSDDVTNPPEDVPQTTIDEVIALVTNNGDLKTWKIESASFTNSNVSDLDVTNAFNIKEDEFRFSANNQTINLEHRQRNDFNREATDLQSFLLDNYKSTINYVVANDADDPTILNATNNTIRFNVVNENLITGEWIIDADTKLAFSLTEKTASDFLNAPSSLNFQEITPVPTEYAFLETLGSADVLASQANNAIYLTYSTDNFPNPNGGSPRAEGVIRYDLGTNQFSNNIFHNADFFTKRAYISNNKLNVLGSQYLNTYDNINTLSNPESSIAYNNIGFESWYVYYRHDLVNINDDVYIIGGNPDSFDDPNNPNDYFDKILIHNNPSSNVPDEVATLPAAKCQAATELVDDTIYILSGTRGFGEYETSETLSYAYDINTGTFTNFNISEALSVSFAVTVENLIYVAGQVRVLNTENEVLDINAYLGVYNTETGTFNEIQTNLDDNDQNSRISGITHLNNTLYIVYQTSNDSSNESYVIMSASL